MPLVRDPSATRLQQSGHADAGQRGLVYRQPHTLALGSGGEVRGLATVVSGSVRSLHSQDARLA